MGVQGRDGGLHSGGGNKARQRLSGREGSKRVNSGAGSSAEDQLSDLGQISSPSLVLSALK